MENITYIEITFDDETKSKFKDLVNELVEESDLYYSTVKKRISGVVTDNLHFTLFWGIDPSLMNSKELIDLVDSIDLKELAVGNLFLMPGFQNLYKILCIEIKDDDKNLFNISERFKSFSLQNLQTREFKPHLTLAYVNPDYEIPKKEINTNFSVNVKEVRISI